MGQYDTSGLRHRQDGHDVGHTIIGSSAKSFPKQRRRAFRVPVAVVALGILLSMWGPLPGLGMVLTMGGVMGLVITAGLVLSDGLS